MPENKQYHLSTRTAIQGGKCRTAESERVSDTARWE